MNVIQLILHIPSVIKTCEDGDKLIQDLIHGQSSGADAVKTLDDIISILSGGVVSSFPAGITQDQAVKMLTDLKEVIQ